MEINSEKVMGQLANYRSRNGIFAKQFLWKAITTTTPQAWWSGLCGSLELSKIAVMILNMPPTSASVERSFSTHKDIHSAKRNRLTTTRSGKLVYVSHNLKLLGKEKVERIEEDDVIEEQERMEEDDMDEQNRIDEEERMESVDEEESDFFGFLF